MKVLRKLHNALFNKEMLTHNEMSGVVKKTKGGKVMRTKDALALFGERISVMTKLGEKEIWRIDLPGECPLAVKRLIFDDFHPVALTAFNQNKSVEWEEDIWKHLFDVDILYLAFNDGVDYGGGVDYVSRGIAFRAINYYDFNDKKIGYVAGTAVDPSYQSYGYYRAFTNDIKDDVDYVVSRTQNPAVVAALFKCFGDMCPVIKEPYGDLKDVGVHMARELGMKTYDKETMVSTGYYGKALSGLPPKIKSEITDKLFKIINRDKGDCVLAVCRTERRK